jgi:ATP-dependent helicase/nuclease subunit B
MPAEPYSTTAPRRRIYTVPAGRPFLRALAEALLAGNLPARGGPKPSPVDLTNITLYLPTRRATRALQDAFLAAASGRAMLLPAILPISEGDEDLSLITEAARGEAGTVAGIGPAISEMHRRLALTQLVLRWSEVMRATGDDGKSALDPYAAAGSSTPAQAVILAGELARLMDMVETEGVSLEGLAALVPELYSEHWQKTLEFLQIVTAYWPAHLEEQGRLSPVARRNAVIAAEARRLRTSPPQGPVIVAGVTGSIPATVELMQAVADLPNGAIVLPALDMHLDEPSWQVIVPDHAEHPQHGLAKLLASLGLERRDVTLLPGAAPDERQTAREKLISEALRPSRTTALWYQYVETLKDKDKRKPALDGLSLIEAPTGQDEAEAIALIMRHAAETPGRTAALVSPDRRLARRVAIRLESWGIRVDDSAGRPFAKTVPGAFLELVIAAHCDGYKPATLMALLKHPLTRLGRDPFTIRRAARALEIAAFRTPYLGQGLDGVAAAIEQAHHQTRTGERRNRAVRRLWAEDWEAIRDLVAALKDALAPLEDVTKSGAAAPIASLARAHVAAAEKLARLPAEDEDAAPSSLWQGEAGEAAQRFFSEILDDTLPELTVRPADYADLYRSLITGINVRPRVPVHPRLFIWGPFEARLQQTDVVVLGSLNDGTWPESADPGPWLNRPMRTELKLPSPEEKIGFAAHDFISLLGAREVILTRSEKVDGVPTVASRWLLRLQALLDGAEARAELQPDQSWLAWARQRDDIVRRPPAGCPEPRPSISLRPRRLSVSRIEKFIANPYAIFAREILGLEALDELGKEPGPSLRGSIIHEALSRFTKAHPASLPGDVRGELIRIARAILDDYRTHPRIAAFWVPRFERFADWFAATEPQRRQGIEIVIAETTGSAVFNAPGGTFTLTARADRIDVGQSGLVITDYKTGIPPNSKRVIMGLSPQLPLEAAIAADTGFANVPAGSVATLRYIRASGGDPPGEQADIKTDDLAVLAANTLDGLKRHIAHYDDEKTPYRPLRRKGFSYDFDEYAHLARVAEWSVVDRDSSDEGEA